MPGGVNLHIRTRSSRSTRVLPLSGVAFRVGPGRQCEVRLDEDGPADVQCLLRRRGETWHVQPVARGGDLALGGKALESPRPFPLGIPLRVGEHYLTLLPPDSAPFADEPILVGDGGDEADVYLLDAEPTGEILETPAPDPEPPAREAEPHRPPPTSAGRPTSGAWEDRLRQRERWLSDRKREGEWEARWKALGENLRASAEARSAGVAPPISRASHRPKPRPKPAPSPERTLRIPPEPAPAPLDRKVAPPRIYQEAEEAASPRANTAFSFPPLQLCLPAPEPRLLAEAVIDLEPVPPLEPAGPASLSDEVGAPKPAWPTLIALSMLEHHDLPTPDAAQSATEAEAPIAAGAADFDAEAPAEPQDANEFQADPTIEDIGIADDLAERLGLPVFQMGDLANALVSPSQESVASSVVTVDWGTVEIPEIVEEPAAPVEAEEAIAPVEAEEAIAPVEAEEAIAPVVAEDLVGPVTTEVVDDAPVEVTVTSGGERPPTPKAPLTVIDAGESPEAPKKVRRPTGPRIAGGPRRVEDMPSVSSILAAGATRPAVQAEPGRRSRAAGRWPRPSEARKPSQWSIPGATWFGVPAAIAASLIGCLMVRQALEWARTDREAGALADRLARLHGVANPDPRALDGLANSEANLPDPSWTRATSAEIALRVAALARAGLDPVREERVAALLDAGRHVAPAQPAIRYALAWRSSQMGEGEGLGSRLGLSRDVATLAWSARQLLDADETGPALELYKKALVLAGMADLDHLDRPAPSDQQQVRRFQMPYESLASLVLRDLIDARRWGLDDWGPALTDFAPIPLAAARLLRERGNPDADRAIELAIEAASGPAPEGCDPAVHLAAGAEALALAGRWAEAEDEYRRALERLGDGDGSTEVWLARCWHYNLADLYARLGEPAREKEARRIALGNAPNDEITRLIMRAQHQNGIPLYDGATTPASFSPVPAGSPSR